MDIEKLTKSQIVLLTLLTSFVTSIATGIVTVSLMEQAPPAIAQTVNRVVERTIEKVVPQEMQAAAAAAPSIVTETVIVRESDLIAKAVQSITPSVVRLFTTGTDESGKSIEIFLGMAVVLDATGTLVADAGLADGSVVQALRSDGERVPATVFERDSKAGIVRLHAATTTRKGSNEESLSWQPAAFTDETPAIGSTVLAIAGRSALKLGHGIVTAHVGGGSQAPPDAIETSISADAFTLGSPLVTINGEIAGLATKDSKSADGRFIASSMFLSYNKPSESSKENQAQSAQ